MSQDFFRIEKGLQLDDTIVYLTGNGAPGSSADTDAAHIGSIYTNNADGSIWSKHSVGTGIGTWSKQASEAYVNNAVGATVSWREPVVVNDYTSTTVPFGTPGNVIVVDGVSISDGDRVLFSAVSGGAGKNVYIYNQATGGFATDSNAQTAGDAVYVQQGTDAGKTFIYNGTDWVQSSQASLDEEGYIRSFIGKPAAGNVSPSYTSTNFVSNGDNLKTAVSKLDLELGANVALGNWITPSNKVNQNLTVLDTKIGANFGASNHLESLSTTGTLTSNIALLDALFGPSLIAGSIVTLGEAAFPAIQAIDIAIGPNVTNGNYILAANKIQQNIQVLDSTIGTNVTNGGYINSADTVQDNIQQLDTAFTQVSKMSTATNVTAPTLLDSISASTLKATKFFVHCTEIANPSNVYATEVYVLCNGTDIDYNKYGTLKLGNLISGLQVSAVLIGGNVSIQVSSTAAVNVTVRRATLVDI